MNKPVVIVGGGILGSALAYWLSLVADHPIVLLEQEEELALHTSSRNTGVVHRPFYLDPKKKEVFARAAQLSYPLWKKYARARALPWNEVGTIEVARSLEQGERLDRYYDWGRANGMQESEFELLQTQDEIHRVEPHLHCSRALLVKTDAATDFGVLARKLARDAGALGATVQLRARVSSIEEGAHDVTITLSDGSKLLAEFLINCAGGRALHLAQGMGVAQDCSDLNFRGDYWLLDPSSPSLARHNIYSVPEFPDYPFLDPHYVVRWDRQRIIGPTAVPVIGPYSYRRLIQDKTTVFEKLMREPMLPRLKCAFDPLFIRLALREWKNAIASKAFLERVREFLPDLDPTSLKERGPSGIRSVILDRSGQMVPEAIECGTRRTLHVLNYNFPGATGAPAYAVRLVQMLFERNGIRRGSSLPSDAPWTARDFDAVAMELSGGLA